MRMKRFAAAVATTLFALPALAHPGQGDVSLGAGLMHPIGGVDHLAAMVAVGLWAGLVGGPRRWLWPAAFVAAMVAGAALGWASLPLAGVEALIAAILLALGVTIALGWTPAVASGGLMIAGFGIAHGFAHGAEMPGETLFSPYAAGFVVATALLHAAGRGLAVALTGFQGRLAPRLAGGALASLGVDLLVGTIAIANGFARCEHLSRRGDRRGFRPVGTARSESRAPKPRSLHQAGPARWTRCGSTRSGVGLGSGPIMCS